MRAIFFPKYVTTSSLKQFSPHILLPRYPLSGYSPSYSGEKNTGNHPIFPLIERLCQHPTEINTVHAHTITTGLIQDPFAASRLVEFCLNSNPHYARLIFDSLERPDLYTWNAMIIGLAERQSPESGIAYYFQMLWRGAPPSSYTFALVVKACIMGKNEICLGRKIHGQMLKHGVEGLFVIKNSLMKMYSEMGSLEEARLLFDHSLDLDLISWNSMISGYGKHGDIKSARELFDKMPKRNLVSWSAMIDGYVRSGDYSESLNLFNEMEILGVNPDVITLVSVLKACANLGALDQGRRVHFYIERNKLDTEMNVILGTALVNMYAKCGCIDVALQMFYEMSEKDVILWNSMILGLALHGHGKDALELFRRMREQGMIPNESTFVGVLCACTHAGLVHQGQEFFMSMKNDYGIEPRVEHYGCLADLLGRNGLVREAEEVLTNMPMDPEASQWGALLSACLTHNNVEVGERVGKRLIALEPDDGGRYVQLSNVYARAYRWEDALETRRMMEEKGIKKERGCSFIE